MPINGHYDKMSHKYYYQYGQTGHKYYFDGIKDEPLAYQQALQQAKAIHVSQAGYGLPGIRQDFPPYVRDLIAKYGDRVIDRISVCRKPLNSNLTTLINVVSLGQVNSQLKKLNYDDLFHLFMIIRIDDGTTLLLQKDEVVDMYMVTQTINVKGGSCIMIDLKDKQIKLGDFINKTVRDVGPSIYLYDGQDNNCQVFIINLLKSNGLLTDDYKSFILQDIQTVLSTSPGWLRKIMNLATDSKALLNRLLYGKAL